MLGTTVNTLAVLAGSLIGLAITAITKKFQLKIAKSFSDRIMQALGLCTLYIGITGALTGKNTMVLILSMILGTLIGEAFDLDDKMNRLGERIENRFKGAGSGSVGIAEGFITASLLFCVGAMTIVGSLQSGLTGNHETLFAKSVMDFVAAIIFASSLGFGVVFSAVFVLVYQGAITLLAQWVSPFLTDTVIQEMSCAGYVIIIALAFNILGISKFKVMNFVPAIFLPIIICRFL
ncbi:MAG: DUF554 domain-containing protein [Lachnospiraceae bacterium]|jgi:uncharacterized membrane protein YqgA involved in biofilm formation|nr:DUF554 domain-containing protein [Lachnospiraceae bacterium]